MADNRYGSSGVNIASIPEFVAGVQAKNASQAKGAATSIAAGLLTAAAITLYRNRRR